MNLVFITEARYTKNNSNNVYYENSSFAYQLWESYLEVFDNVIVVARVNYDADHDEKKSFLASGNRVQFIELPYFIGPKDYALNFYKLRKEIQKILFIKDAIYLCRVPGNIGHTAIKILQKNKKKYGVEVVGDPWDVFAKGSVDHPLRRWIRLVSCRRLKYDVKHAKASLFVTEKYLQQRYAPSPGSYTAGVSDVIIASSDFFSPEERKKVKQSKYSILSVGSLEQMYKSPDILLKSISEVVRKGYDVTLNWLGDGLYKSQMMDLAENLGIQNHVNFLGNVGKDEVRTQMQHATVFALVSRTEGLPRAMVEAMANSLPCIGTKVGGIPELLQSDCLVDVNDITATSNLIIKFITDINFRAKQSERNFAHAKSYEQTILRQKRKEFLEQLKSNIS